MSVISSHDSASARPRVLVLLAAYNGAEWITEQIDSILRQEKVDVRVVIQDDGSSDRTVSILTELASLEPRLEVFVAESPSGSAARNFFSLIVSQAGQDADFVSFSDQDDVWNVDKLHRAAEALSKTVNAGYSGAVTAHWPDGRLRILSQNGRSSGFDYLFEGGGQGCTFVLTMPLYQRIRAAVKGHTPLLRNIHFHDWVIYALARQMKAGWVFDPCPVMTYRQHGGNDIGARSGWGGAMLRLRRIRDGWYAAQLCWIADLLCKVDASDPGVDYWWRVLHGRRGTARRLRIALFCFYNGRRRWSDRAVLVLSALMGWI